ncbi:MAG: hypothetical protein M5U26_03580 [Planctomycetota bacterium]|nr:hypothetical protein [Planctomycetota bacterium]
MERQTEALTGAYATDAIAAGRMLLGPDAGPEGTAGGGGVEVGEDLLPADGGAGFTPGEADAGGSAESIYGPEGAPADDGTGGQAAGGAQPPINYEQEYTRASGRAEQLEQLLDKLLRVQQGPAPAAAAAGQGQTASGAQPFDLNLWVEQLKRDAPGAYARMFEHILDQRPELLTGRIGGLLDQRLAPYEQQMLHERHASQYAQLAASDPDARDGTPAHKATADFLASNPWITELAYKFPRLPAGFERQHPELAGWLAGLQRAVAGVNWPRLAYQAAAFPLLKAQVAGGQKRLGLARQKASSARPGAGGPALPKAGNTADLVDAMLARGTQQGIEFSESDRELLMETLDKAIH